MAIPTDHSAPPTQPTPGPKKQPRIGLFLLALCGLAIAYFAGLGVGGANATVQPVAQPAPSVTTRTVTVPGPTVTVPGPTVTVPGPTVTVQASQPASASTAPAAGSSFSSGTYEVGTEIEPGTYRTSGSDFCYWSRLNSNDGELGSINANGFADGPSSMSVKAGDKYIEFSGTCSWTRR
ncbi:flagellar basal body-associated FliL family protein [Actinomycetospora sp. C-140]